jgi:hypothetical protein
LGKLNLFNPSYAVEKLNGVLSVAPSFSSGLLGIIEMALARKFAF